MLWVLIRIPHKAILMNIHNKFKWRTDQFPFDYHQIPTLSVLLCIPSNNELLISLLNFSHVVNECTIKALQASMIPRHEKLIQYNGRELGKSRAITLDLIDAIYPSTIPNHFFLISTLTQSLKKICQKKLKTESGNKLLTSIKGNNSRLN